MNASSKVLQPYCDEAVVLRVLIITFDVTPEILRLDRSQSELLLSIRNVRNLLRQSINNPLVSPSAIDKATTLLIELAPRFPANDRAELREIISRAVSCLNIHKQQRVVASTN